MTTETPTAAPICQRCGQPGIPIVYGLPGPELFEAAEAGRVALGGCVIYDEMPIWRCSAGHEWADD